jgi:tetratricopeptide (TPR) repeat protein
MSSREFDRFVSEAARHYAAGRWSAAAKDYRSALAVSPGHPRVLHNLGVVAATQGDQRAAIELFDAAIQAEPRYASAHYNRAVALQELGQRVAAIEAFSIAVALDPENYAAHRAVAICLLAQGLRGRALDHFARTYDLRRGDDRNGMSARSLATTNAIKLKHDAEQFGYLARGRRDAERFAAMSRTYESLARDFPSQVTELSASELEMLGDGYNTPVNLVAAPEIGEGALAPRPDHDSLVGQFAETGMVHVDDLLTPRAFAGLRRYLLESTIWHDFTHISGFLATYLEDGLACPLLLQIVDELRGAFPELLGSVPLTQAWAFKAMESGGSIDVHSDDAAISVNLWMTPTEANLSADHGGLGICLAAPPRDWSIGGYGGDHQRSVLFLEQNRNKVRTVSYRENRAVIFSSRFVHYSDAPRFAEGYENRRVNITLLFGQSGQYSGVLPVRPSDQS